MTERQKAKRKLFNFDFSKDGARVDLVGVDDGGSANGFSVLVTKGTNHLPDVQVTDDEVIEVQKALEQITVKLSMEEFLRKFFHVYSSDAEVLTKLLGFETEHEAYLKTRDSEEEYDWAEEHEKWITDRMSQFSIMKSMNAGSVETITKSDYLSILALQEKLEPALESYTQEKEKEMEELQIAKSALAEQTEVVKSLNAQVEALQAEVNLFKSAKETAEQAAFTESLKGLVADEKLESVAKALFAQSKVDAEGVATIVETLKATKQSKDATVEASGLLTEQSHSADVDVEKARNQKLVDALNADAKNAIR